MATITINPIFGRLVPLSGFTTLPLGGGGALWTDSILADTCRTDTFGGYIKRIDSDGRGLQWQQVITAESIGDVAPLWPGVYFLARAPSNYDVAYAVFPPLRTEVATSERFKWRLRRSVDQGRHWTDPIAGWATSQDMGQGIWNLTEGSWKGPMGRCAIDPFNEDHVILACSPNSSADQGVWDYIHGDGFTQILDYEAGDGNIKKFSQYIVRFDPSGGTTTVSGNVVCKNVFIGVGGHGGLWSTDGGASFTNMFSDPTPSPTPYAITVANNSVIGVTIWTPGNNLPSAPTASGLTFHRYGAETNAAPYYNGTAQFWYAPVVTGGTYTVTVNYHDGCIDTVGTANNSALIFGVAGGMTVTNASTIFDGIATVGQLTAVGVTTANNNTLSIMMQAQLQHNYWENLSGTMAVDTICWDSVGAALYRCSVSHTHPGGAASAFATYRASNPSHWTAYSATAGWTEIQTSFAERFRTERRYVASASTAIGSSEAAQLASILVTFKGDATIALSGTPSFVTSGPASEVQPVSITNAVFDFAGTAYIDSQTGRNDGSCWRWVPSDGANTAENFGLTLGARSGAGLAADPREGYEGRVFVVSNGRPTTGYAPDQYIGAGVDLGSVVWTGSLSYSEPRLITSDAGWLVELTQQGASGGGVITPDGEYWIFTGVGPSEVTFDDETDYSANVRLRMNVAGIEQLCASDVVRSPGSPYPVALVQDFMILPAPTPDFPPAYFPGANQQGIGTQGDFAWGTGFMFGAIGHGQTSPNCCWSDDYGVTWTMYPDPNPVNDNVGGPSVAVGAATGDYSDANIVLVPNCGAGVIPIVTLHNFEQRTQSGTRTSASATLTSVADTSGMRAGMAISGTGIPASTTIVSKTSSTIVMSANASSSGTDDVLVYMWTNVLSNDGGSMAGSYTINLQNRARALANNRDHQDEFMLVKPDGDYSGIQKSIDKGLSFTKVGTFALPIGGTGSFIEHIPGHGTGYTYIMASLNAAGALYITENSGTTVTNINTDVSTVILVCPTKGLPGAAYPSIMLFGAVALASCYDAESVSHAGEVAIWRSSDLYGTLGSKWKWIAAPSEFPPINQHDAGQVMRPDWEDADNFYIAMNGSGFVHFHGRV